MMSKSHLLDSEMDELEIEAPSPKRPRLSIFSQTTGVELDAARQTNDLTLKNRFEAIFAKYTQDFTGIGDEIDLMTGEIVVNNGHLASMEAETDLGLDHLAGEFTSVGRSMLRAMTVTLNPDLPGPDDVLMSIESIAENAALADDVSSEISSDDLFDTPQCASRDRSQSSSKLHSEHADASIDPYNSDSDSLFEQDIYRADSVDSLFDGGDRINVEARMYGTDEIRSDLSFESELEPEREPELMTPLTNLNGDDEVIARFGPYVGKEILHIIDQRRDAEIEPAWRIPVRLETVKVNQSISRTLTSSPLEESPESKRNQSLWSIPKPSKKQKSHRDTPIQRTREESVDPLQEDSDAEASSLVHLDAEMTGSDNEFVEENVSTQMLLDGISATGDCPYCEMNFKDRQGVMSHWDRMLKRPPSRVKKHDPHDVMVMKEVRASVPVRRGLLRLVVKDFRTMIELHEGAKMTFDEIAASKTLRTRKTGLQLQEIYNKYRTPPDWNHTEKSTKKWTDKEEAVLHRLCDNPLSTMTSFERSLKGRSESEIGNRLAENWLIQLNKSREDTRATLIFLDQPAAAPQLTTEPLAGRYVEAGDEQSKSFDIKEEESDDELFLGR